jgi:hypothetical protein
LLKEELEEEMVTVLVSCGGGRKKKKICSWDREEGWFFGLLWTRFSPPPGHQIHLYLYAVEEGNLFYNEEKFQLLIQLGRIPTIDSK